MQNIEHENVFLFFSLDSMKIFLKESRQKTFVMLSRFWPFKGVGGLGEANKKG